MLMGVLFIFLSPVLYAQKKPNILGHFCGDDIGVPQVSAYTMGMMGYKTPNIDRIAKEGCLFTDAYSQNSCTAGRASFISGPGTFRTGSADNRHARRSTWYYQLDAYYCRCMKGQDTLRASLVKPPGRPG